MKVLVGMSGGVDSSLAALLVKNEGYDVLGVTMCLTRKEQIDAPGFINHGSIEEARDSESVAKKIGIPFETWDMSELYKDKVVMEFVRGYERGETPNPCVACNQNIKFAALVAKAQERGYERVATGHYARVLRTGDDDYQNSGVPELHRSPNQAKDQSYFVASMPPKVVQYCDFPLGNYSSKETVRELAKEAGFVTHNKKDSADVCFLAKKAKDKFLGAHFGDKYAGNIITEGGIVLGEHSGYWNFTVGQRQGINLKTPRKDGRPRYVIEIRPETREVVVGPKELLWRKSIVIVDVKYFDKACNFTGNEQKLIARAQIRAHGKAILSEISQLENGKLQIDALEGEGFESVARGQSLVMYDAEFNSRVLMKGTIQ